MSTNRTLAKLLATGLLVAGVGAGASAAADEPFRSASTPERIPTVSTPRVATPMVQTPTVVTPSQRAAAAVQPIRMPAGATADLDGLVDDELGTPEATPAIVVAPEVPSLTVDVIDVAPVQVDEIGVDVTLPLAATVGTDSSNVRTTSDLPTSMQAQQDGDGASADAGPASADIGLDL